MEPAGRRQALKKGFESSRFGGKRASDARVVTLRKTIKERLLQRRRVGSATVSAGSATASVGFATPESESKDLTKTPDEILTREEDRLIQELQGAQMIEKIREHVALMVSAVEEAVRYRATVFIRKLSSRKHEPPLYDIAEANGIEAAGAVLQFAEHMPSRISAAWILTNIASDQHELTRLVIEKDMIRHLIEGFKSANFDLHYQCLWALANIAGDEGESCNVLRKPPYSIVPVVAGFALSTTHAAEVQYCRHTAWFMSNLCRKHPGKGGLIPLLPALAYYLEHPDNEVLVDVSEALRWYTEEDEGAAAAAKAANRDPHPELTALVNHPTLLARLVARLTEYLVDIEVTPPKPTPKSKESRPEEDNHDAFAKDDDDDDDDEDENDNDNDWLQQAGSQSALRADIAENLLKTLANVALGTDYQTDRLLLAGALPSFEQALLHPVSEVVKEACYILSNLATGSEQQIQRLLNLQLLRTVAAIAQTRNSKVQTEALFVFVNIGQYGTTAQVRWFVEKGEGLPQVCLALESFNLKLVACALMSIKNILQLGTTPEVRQDFSRGNKYAELVEELFGLEKIHQLKDNGNTSISDKASEILDTYFDVQTEDDDQDQAGSSDSKHPLAHAATGFAASGFAPADSKYRGLSHADFAPTLFNPLFSAPAPASQSMTSLSSLPPSTQPVHAAGSAFGQPCPAFASASAAGTTWGPSQWNLPPAAAPASSRAFSFT